MLVSLKSTKSLMKLSDKEAEKRVNKFVDDVKKLCKKHKISTCLIGGLIGYQDKSVKKQAKMSYQFFGRMILEESGNYQPKLGDKVIILEEILEIYEVAARLWQWIRQFVYRVLKDYVKKERGGQ